MVTCSVSYLECNGVPQSSGNKMGLLENSVAFFKSVFLVEHYTM